MSKGIYCYEDLKNNNEIVYIGRDSYIHNNTRHKQHMESSRYNAQPFNRILQNNPQRYEYHKLIESNNFTNNDLNDLETHYITEINPRFNYTTGGNDGFTFSEETRRKMSKNNGRYWKGKKRPKEFREHLSKIRKGNNNPSWKGYPRIIKKGFYKGKQKYALIYNNQIISQTTNYNKLSEKLEKLKGEIGDS